MTNFYDFDLNLDTMLSKFGTDLLPSCLNLLHELIHHWAWRSFQKYCV